MIGFGALVLYAVVGEFVYPRWIHPLLTIDRTLAGRQEVYEKLKRTEDEVRRGKEHYQALVARVGSFDTSEVQNRVRSRLTAMIEKHQLQSANISPARAAPDRKTGIATMTFTVTGTATPAATVAFLKEVAELPQVCRIGNASISPASSASRTRELEFVNLRVPIEVMVLPKQKLVGPIDLATLTPPEKVVRHENREYAIIASKEPFTEPIPVAVDAGKTVTTDQNKKANLSCKAVGGDGKYVYQWQPAEGLNNATAPNPELDTSSPRVQTYTCTVVDGHGRSATAEVQVNVRELQRPPGPPVADRPEKPAGSTGPIDKRWKERQQLQLTMTLQHTMGEKRIAEVMLMDTRSRKTRYVAVGEELDGADLIFVHPTGGLVKRDSDYMIYPIGETLASEMSVTDPLAMDYPDLIHAADQHRKALEAPKLLPAVAPGKPGDVSGEGPFPPSAGETPEAGTVVAPGPATEKPAGGEPAVKPAPTKPRQNLSNTLQQRRQAMRNARQQQNAAAPGQPTTAPATEEAVKPAEAEKPAENQP